MKALFISISLMVIFLAGCGGHVPVQPTIPKGIPLGEMCKKYHVQWEWDGVTQVVILNYRGNKAKVLVGSRMVMVGRDKIELSFPVRRENSIIYVPDDFEAKVLAPFGVIVGQPGVVEPSVAKVRTVVIDAGHGGKDPGAIGRVAGIKEKDVNLAIAKRLKDLLQQAGFKVVMTRDSDVYLSLPERTVIATNANPDIFVSIHANSNPSSKVQGLEVYYVKTQFKKDLDEEQRQINEKKLLKALNATPANHAGSILADLMYQRKVEDSRQLANIVAKHIVRQTQSTNRGVKPCRFFVVRNTLIPAVLVESGYLTNRQEERKLSTSAYQQKIAEGIAQSMMEYANN